MILKNCLKFYKRIISPLLHLKPNSGCRFYPTCSEYAYQAIKKHGIVRGIYRSIKRITRCHPFSQGGYDPA